MMKRNRAAMITLLLLPLLIGVAGIWLHPQQRQYALNRRLIAALVKNDTEQALALVNAGADPNTHYNPPPIPSLNLLLNQLLHRQSSTDNSPTAFMMACGTPYLHDPTLLRHQIEFPDDPALAKTMLAHGASLHMQANDGWTALLGAAYATHVQAAKLLLEQGADTNVAGQAGMTPLMWAAMNDSNALVRILLAHGAKVNIQDNPGETVLHFAFKPKYNINTMRLLLTHGANPNIGDMYGLTPLTLAKETGRPDIVALFKHYGARK
jgi:ankyrin repeat protein